MVLKVQSVGRQRLGRKSAALWIAAAVLVWVLGSAELVGRPGLKDSVPLGWLKCITLQLVLAAVEISVVQMLKLHLSFMKVSAVAAGTDDRILLPCFERC